ncbi:hypothetical protein Tco_0905248 [Tanacetum coccineum]
MSVRIGSDSPIKLVILNHLHVGTLDKKIVGNRELNNSGTRCWSNGPSARPHRLVIRINDDYVWGIGRSFKFLHQYFDFGRYNEKFLDERTLSAGLQSSLAGRQCGRRGESQAAKRSVGAAEQF